MNYRYCIIALLLLAPMVLAAKKKPHVPDSLRVITVQVGPVSIVMQRVEGGSFVMGATPDQYDRDTYTNKPAHLVFLSPFYIATTEVTNRLWKTVMPDRESLSPSGYPEHPVSFVSWHDAQLFVHRLDSLTGLPFRLPTEAEWEYAARGGEKSRKNRFAGSDEPDSVGWTYAIAGQWTHPVALKHPNELGLYDMTGNVAEWCQDLYGPYQLSTSPNPCGADTGSYRIVRGGSYDEARANSHLSVRKWYTPETTAGYIGFRLAFTLPNDPIGSVLPAGGMPSADEEDLPLTQKVRIKGRKLTFTLVTGEQPYYISEEVSAALWEKVMEVPSPDKERGMAIGMSRSEREHFAEQCSRLAEKPMAVVTKAETAKALAKGVITQPKDPKPKKSARSTQSKRKARSRFAPWAELVGAKVKIPDDPILSQYQASAEENQPLRLVMRLRN